MVHLIWIEFSHTVRRAAHFPVLTRVLSTGELVGTVSASILKQLKDEMNDGVQEEGVGSKDQSPGSYENHDEGDSRGGEGC